MDFAVETSRAGKGEATVEIIYQGRTVPAKIGMLDNGMYKVTFTPHGAGLYTIHVYFNGMEVRGSPFTIEIFDTSTVSASGEGLKLVPVLKPSFFAINTKGATSKDLQVTVTGPTERSLPVQVLDAGRPNAYKAEYTPTEVGEHSIAIAFFDKAIRGSPFKSYAYDARQIRVGQIPNGFVGKPVEFEIVGSQAGSGNLEIVVNGGRVVSHVKALGDQRFLASFTPMDAMTHTVEMRFNSDTVPGSPWNVQIWDLRNVTARDIPKHFQINRTTAFEINASNVGVGELKVDVLSPSMRTVNSYTSEVRSGVYKCEFTSSEVGSHSIAITYAGTTITGSPFTSKGFDANKIKLSKISSAFVGLPVQFQVDASQAGEGQLEISINNGRVPNKMNVQDDGQCIMTFTPQNAQPHWIDVKFNGEQVPGSPIQCNVLDSRNISASGPGLRRVCIGRLSKFLIDSGGAGEADVVVAITSPSNRQVPSRVLSIANVGYEVEWTAQEVGPHTVTMEYGGQLIGGGPHHVKAYDPMKVRVSNVDTGFVGKPVAYKVETNEAGEGIVEMVVKDKSSQSVATTVQQFSTSSYQISFIPKVAGHYKIDLTFNKDPIPGSPFWLDVTETLPVLVKVSGEGLGIAQVGEVSRFQISTEGASPETVETLVLGPDGRKLPVRILSNHNYLYIVEYVAQVAGIHRIVLTFRGVEVEGSPYTVKAFDVKAVHVGDIPDGTVGKSVTFTVDASHAGSGNLEVAVNNGRVQTSADALGNNRYAITFTPRSTELHLIDIKFNGVTCPGCPFHCNILDASRVTATGDGLQMVPVYKPATFKVDIRGSAPAECESVVTAPSGKRVPVRISGSHTSSFKAEYIPTEVGDHLVEIKYASEHLRGSPFVCRVYESNRVVVTQTKTGIVGKPVNFHVDASEAGAGNLEIIVGVNGKNVPNFVQTEGNAKFKVTFTPQEAKPHQVRVRFNNHIAPGTPYDCEIIDGSVCTASGDGLRLAGVANPAWFVVDPQGVRPAELKATITAPSGKIVPVAVTGSAQSKFRAEYVPTEVGPHTITVLYAETPISGSPFTCNVFDASRIKVNDIGHGVVGRSVKFQVDASSAGEGKLDVVVTSQGAEVRADIAPIGRGKYEVSFIPREVIAHFIDVQFNDTQVDGAPFRCDIIDGSRCTAEGDGLRRACVSEMAWFELDHRAAGNVEAEVKIIAPSGARVPSIIRKTSRGTQRVEYTPLEVGPHKIMIKYAESPITGSPFKCEVYDSRNVRLSELADGFVGKEYTFRVDASTAGHGEMEIEIESSNRPVKATVHPTSTPGQFDVTFVPRDAGLYGITVKFADRVIPGCSQKMMVHDPGLITATGDGLRRTCVGEISWVEIDAKRAATTEVEVKITSPSGARIPVQIMKSSRGGIRAEYTATEVGSHKLSCKYAGTPLNGSPFICEAYDPRQVKTKQLHDAYVAKNSTIAIDASMAGQGEIEVEIEGNNRPVKSAVSRTGNGLYEASFTPRDSGIHEVNVKFANHLVPGSPFKITVHDPGLIRVTGDGLKRALRGETAWFEIDSRGVSADAGIKITSPSGARVPIQVTKNSRGVIHVEYAPTEVGAHRVSCKYAGTVLTGSPFTCEVYDPSQIRLKDLHDSYVGKENEFLIDASHAGNGELEVDVDSGNHTVPCSIHKTASMGIYRVSFIPRDTGPHNISVKFSSHPIPSSPFRITMHDASSLKLFGDGLKHCRVGQKARLSCNMRGGQLDGNDIDVLVTAPNGIKIPVKLSQQGKGEVQAEFLPKMVGPHRVEVKFMNEHVNGSPFISEAYDSSKVRVKDFPDSCCVDEPTTFEVTSKDAGNSELLVKVFGPSGHLVPIEIVDSHDSKRIRFTPTESGKHKLHALYGEEESPGSPFTFMVDEPGFPTASGDRLVWALADEPAVFRVDVNHLRGKLEVTAHGPTSIIKTTSAAEKHGVYKVTYLPVEVGTYDIKIMWNGKEIPDSPFHPRIFDPSKARVIGGWAAHLDEKDRVKMRVAEEKKVIFDVGQAGPGKLSAEVRGPSGLIPVKVETVTKERVKVSFTALVEGHHDVHIWWSEQPIPHSPFPGWAEPGTVPVDVSFVRLRGRGLTEARVRAEAEFVIDGSEAGPGEPEVHISGIKADIPVTLQRLGTGVYKATYTAAHQGTYLSSVKWSGEVVKGCPYKLSVSSGADASKVVVNSESMRSAMFGKELKSFIDTRRAGPGELSVHCMGPTKQSYCELFDHRDGTYTLQVKPAEAGRHLLTIKYNSEHVPGSPFAIKILGSPDPSKVRVYGPGVNHGVLPTYASRFMCETKGAGAGQLTVRVRGPKGAFRVEMQRESQKDRTILCKYDPTEPGDYRIEVKWSGEHVPGSPFNIWIFDTEDELNRFLRTGEVPRSSSPSLPQAYGPVSEYTYGNGHVGSYGSPSPQTATSYSQWRRGSADI